MSEAKKKGWDLTTKHSLDAAAEWVRSKSDAILVLVIRGEEHGCDMSFAVAGKAARRGACTGEGRCAPEGDARQAAQGGQRDDGPAGGGGVKPIWWTCGCGEWNCSPREAGTPVCDKCGKPAKFTVAAPQGQRGFEFGGEK